MSDKFASSSLSIEDLASGPEVWREIKGYEGYYAVSTFGRVKSLARSVSGKPCVRAPKGRLIPIKERILKPGIGSGRFHLTLWKDHEKWIVSVHKLVTDAFLGPIPEGMQRCHNDGNCTNNKLSNLRYDTPVNNNADKRAHGTHVEGEKIPWSKVTEEDVISIRERYKSGVMQKVMAEQYGIKQPAISRIISGKNWTHVKEGLS